MAKVTKQVYIFKEEWAMTAVSVILKCYKDMVWTALKNKNVWEGAGQDVQYILYPFCRGEPLGTRTKPAEKCHSVCNYDCCQYHYNANKPEGTSVTCAEKKWKPADQHSQSFRAHRFWSPERICTECTTLAAKKKELFVNARGGDTSVHFSVSLAIWHTLCQMWLLYTHWKF